MYSEQQATISKRGRADLFWKYDLDYLPEIAKTAETGFDYGKDTGLKLVTASSWWLVTRSWDWGSYTTTFEIITLRPFLLLFSYFLWYKKWMLGVESYQPCILKFT